MCRTKPTGQKFATSAEAFIEISQWGRFLLTEENRCLMEILDPFNSPFLPLSLCRLILRGGSLPFGDCPEELRKEPSVEEAMQTLSDRLISYLPKPPGRILDVGCGLGPFADMLHTRGFDVTAISPSPEIIQYGMHRCDSHKTTLRVADFFDSDEAISAEGSYDTVFFKETLPYIETLHAVMKKTRHLLKDKGVVIIGDEVSYDETIKAQAAVPLARDIYAALSENGFRIIENDRLGERVVPACEAALQSLTEHLQDRLAALDDPDVEKNLSFLLDGWRKQKSWHESGRFGYEIFVGKKDAFHVRPYVPGDEDEILRLFNEVFKTDRSLDHWYWKFRDNPYGSHRICVGISPEGEIVSQYAGYPLPFCSTIEEDESPRSFLTVHAGDTFTHPRVRRIGLGKTGLIARTTFYYYAKFLEGFVPFAYGFNTATIKKLGERYLGYRFGDPVVLWAKGLSRGRHRRLRFFDGVFSGFKVDEVFSISDEWDEFFACVCPAYEFLVKRDAAYLRWRYQGCPDKRYRIFAVRKKGILTGWGVFSTIGTRLVWGDALFDSHCLGSVSFLLRHVLAAYPRHIEGIDAWFSRNPHWWCDHLRSIGFESAPQPDGLTLCYRTFRNDMFNEASVTERLNGHFYYTWGDSDLF